MASHARQVRHALGNEAQVQGHTFLPTTVAHITRRERPIGLLVVWGEGLASASARTRSTWIGVNPCLTEREKGEGEERKSKNGRR
jgi:hypothetical protein